MFNKFLSDCRYMPQLRRYSPTKLCDGAKNDDFLRPVFSASRVQHISVLRPKFALRPHHMVDIQSVTAENRREKMIDRIRRNRRAKI